MEDLNTVRKPDWSTAPDWAESWGRASWSNEWCWFLPRHPEGVYDLVDRENHSLPYLPFTNGRDE